jgi:hypothetical protein
MGRATLLAVGGRSEQVVSESGWPMMTARTMKGISMAMSTPKVAR